MQDKCVYNRQAGCKRCAECDCCANWVNDDCDRCSSCEGDEGEIRWNDCETEEAEGKKKVLCEVKH